MVEIKFYYFPGACSLAPHILLRETGVDFEPINMKAIQIGEDFRRINPKMKVPVISLGQDTITELPAVATAIASLAPDMGLLGRTPLDTVRVYEWMNWLSGTLHGGGFSHLFRPERYSIDPGATEGIKAGAIERIKDGFDYIEARLKGVHAVGDAFTAVDPYLLVFYRWGNNNIFEMKDRYPKYTALVSNLVQRSAVSATLEVEDITSTL